ncbi:SRPBCC family protein [Isoalcanivorax indicus]|uniref:SRPBCC family protein n=1 Tax=Isoalcanivorax indicus TaxID=2202653 RepID=UPI000DB949E9|nr:SRPBCC family protein [Isoalcanivorax indicus]
MRSAISCLVLPIALLSLSACVSVPATDPSFSTEPPRQVDRSSIIHTVEVDIQAPADALLDWIITVPLEDVFLAYRSLPGVATSEVLTDTWGTPGTRRRVRLEDGHQVVEQLLSVVPGEHFSYQLWGFTNEAGLLAEYAIGRFELESRPGGELTRVTWTYSFTPKGPVRRIPLSLFVRTNWRGYMSAALERLGAEADSHFAAAAQNTRQNDDGLARKEENL